MDGISNKLAWKALRCQKLCFQSSSSGYKYIFLIHLNHKDGVTLSKELHYPQFVSKQPAVEQHYHPTGIPSVFFFSIFWLLFLACCFRLFCFASHQLFRQTSGTLSDYLLDFLHVLTASSVDPCLWVRVVLFVWSAVAWKVVAVRTTLV